jgi:hypothetical protein
MSEMLESRTIKVVVKRDHIAKLASGSPEFALSEMVWNSLDADASLVNISFHEGPLGIDKIVIEDNGTGIPFDEAESLFISLGGSWKSKKIKTDGGRFLHGRDGRGRFKAFVLGQIVVWNIVYKKNGELYQYLIKGISESLDEFSITEEQKIKNRKPGVKLEISGLSKAFHILSKEKAMERLTPIFALYLSKYPSVTLKIAGTPLDPAKAIRNQEKFPLSNIEEDGNKYDVSLEIVEWTHSKDRELLLCDQYGFPLEQYDRQIRGVGDFGFSAYLSSEFFQYLNSENALSIGDFNPQINKICEKAIKLIKEYFTKRSLERAKDQIQQWKDDEIYPYYKEAETPVEVAERQVFEIIALNINENLTDFEQTDKKTKKFQFRMLRQALEKSPHELQIIISEVLQLPKDKQEQLSELLKDTSLSGIISASQLVSDRLKFLSGLEHMLFDLDSKKCLKERTQLHRILAENTWIFGHAFSLTVDDKSLTEVLKRHSDCLNENIIINESVKRLDGSVGIVDLMLSRSVPRNHSHELEHLIVELKAPRVKIGEKEIMQIKNYAFAVAKDERFKGLDTIWHFWVISNDIDEYAEMELSQEKYENGIIFKSNKPKNITIWIKTWSQLLQENKYRLGFLRDKLNYNIDREDALKYLKKTYSEYTKGLLTINTDDENH